MSDSFATPAPEILTSRLRLRALKVDDAPAVFSYASDPEVTRFTLWPAHPNEPYTRGFLQFFTAPTMLNWAMVLPGSPDAIGMVFLHSLNQHHKKAEIAFNLARSHWNRGVATEAATAILDYAFDALALNRIEATCMPANTASRRVLLKIGMTCEGRTRQSHARHDGFHDMDLYGVLRSERRR